MTIKLNDYILPVGSVIKFKNSKFNLTILGYLPEREGKIYDYYCIKSKCGLNRDLEKLKYEKDIFYINNDEIEEVLFMGYRDEKSKLLTYIVKKVKNEYNKNKKINDEDVKRLVEELKGELLNGI